MNLSTSFLGFQLPHPLMAGASPMVDDLDTVKRLEDAGVSAIVMHSLFEEQITREQLGTILDMEIHSANSAEALSYFPEPSEFRLGPENYLDQIRRIKAAVAVPVIASLNGVSPSGWLDYARLMEQAGADALELNVYYLATGAAETGAMVEQRTLDAVRTVKSAVRIPVAVKLSPFHSSLPTSPRPSRPRGRTAWSSSTASSSPTSTWSTWTPMPPCASPPPANCPCASAGWASSTAR